MTHIQEMQEGKRLAEDLSKTNYWKRWGAYLSDRQWGTVREYYSADGIVWDSFPHDQARSRAYRWGRMGSPGCVIPISGCVLPLPSGMAKTIF